MAKIKLIEIKGDTAADRILDAWKQHSLDKLKDDDKKILERITEVEKRFHEKKLVKDASGDYVYDDDGNPKKSVRPYTWKDLVEFLIEKFQISNRQAYADIELAKRFFLLGRTKFDKAFARGYRIEQGEDLMYSAIEAGELGVAALYFKEIVKLEGLDKWEEDKVDPSLFQPMQPVIVDDPSDLNFPKMNNPDAVVARLMKSFKQKAIDKVLDDAETIEPEDEGS